MAKTRLGGSTATFSEMMKRFGIVTVMNAKVYDTAKVMGNTKFDTLDAQGVLDKFNAATTANGLLCELDTLKVANISIEGPSKTVTGGQYSNPLIKFGKSARLEMQDALGNVDAIDALCGGVTEYTEGSGETARTIDALHFGEDFNGPRTIIGESFFIDQPTGQQVPVKVIFYQFLPDSIFNLTQDAEGDATVFDMNGDLLTTVIKTYDSTGADLKHGMFYSIVDGKEA